VTGPGALACAPNLDLVPTSGSYSVQAPGGFITTWSTFAGTDLGSAALLVWRPTTPGPFTLVAASPLQSLATPNALNTFTLATPIPVQAGDVIGLRIDALSVDCALPGSLTDSFGATAAGTALNGVPQWIITTDFFLNLSATVGPAVTPPPPPPTPSSKEDCKNGGWKNFVDASGQPFSNQGDCVSSVASSGNDQTTGGDNNTGDQTTGGDHTTGGDNTTAADYTGHGHSGNRSD
jgi:hypothetical protein